MKTRLMRSIGAGLIIAGGILLFSVLTAAAQERSIANLKTVPPGQQVTAVNYCRGEYDVGLGDGTTRKFKEYDLAFKIDSTPNGPTASKPALVPTGRVGDRALVIFAELEELQRALKARCRE